MGQFKRISSTRIVVAVDFFFLFVGAGRCRVFMLYSLFPSSSSFLQYKYRMRSTVHSSFYIYHLILTDWIVLLALLVFIVVLQFNFFFCEEFSIFYIKIMKLVSELFSFSSISSDIFVIVNTFLVNYYSAVNFCFTFFSTNY